jgi:hypothetical protein
MKTRRRTTTTATTTTTIATLTITQTFCSREEVPEGGSR